MFKSEFERRADQVRGQMESLRSSLDEVLSNYNRLLGTAGDTATETQGTMSALAQQARGAVGSVGDTLGSVSDTMPDVGFSWWIPVAVIGAIAAGMWIVNTFFPRAAEEARDQFQSYASGMQSPFGGSQSSFGSSPSPYGEQQ